MSNFIDNVQDRVKTGSKNLTVFFLRTFSGLILGLVFALAGQELLKFGTFVFWFITLVVIGVVLRASQNWTAYGVFLFDLVCVLIGLLLRMYIFLAPG